MKRWICVIISVLLLNAYLNGETLLDRVRNTLHSEKPFSVEFVQQVYDGDELIAEESGIIFFKSVKRIKWEYLDPDYKVFVLENNQYRYYDKENEQLTLGTISENRRKWIWQILISSSGNDQIVITKRKLSIKNEKDDIDLEIDIGPRFLPVKVTQIQGAGIKYIYQFKNYRGKLKFSDSIFTLKVPKGTEIVEME